MRYQNLKSFHKHLASAAPSNLCRFYFVAIQDDFERLKTIGAILSYVGKATARYSGAEADLSSYLDSIQTLDLFGESVFVFDEIDQLSKKEVERLSSSLNRFGTGYLLFGSRSKGGPLAAFIETEGVVIDLLDEKPWDKEKRLAEELIERAKKKKKRLSLEACSLLFERVGIDPPLLESELDKLICYVGERGAVEREDVLSISPASRLSTLWQTGEEIVWEGGKIQSADSSFFHGLVPILRNQLHLGLVLSVLIEEGRPSSEWGAYLPKLWPKTLEKRSSQAARIGSFYFRRGLETLFEIETASRSGSIQYLSLLHWFQGKLYAR